MLIVRNTEKEIMSFSINMDRREKNQSSRLRHLRKNSDSINLTQRSLY